MKASAAVLLMLLAASTTYAKVEKDVTELDIEVTVSVCSAITSNCSNQLVCWSDHHGVGIIQPALHIFVVLILCVLKDASVSWNGVAEGHLQL